jgi:hypothetical protein
LVERLGSSSPGCRRRRRLEHDPRRHLADQDISKDSLTDSSGRCW